MLTLFSPVAHAQTITGFEGLTLGQNGNIMFRQPTFSGSTASFLATTSNESVITNQRANTSTQSMRVSFQFLANQTNPFLRLTTASAPALPNPAINLTMAVQFALYVPTGTPDFDLSLGIRETGIVTTIGGNGGTTGNIELAGATSAQGAAPIGERITTKDAWINILFNLPLEPVRSFVGGNGVLNGSFGTLEGLYITPTSNANVGPYTIFLDDFRQTPTVGQEPGSLALLASLCPLLPLMGLRMRKRGKA